MSRVPLRAAVAIILVLLVGTMLLLFFGTRGAEIANVLALFLGGVGAVAAVLTYLQGIPSTSGEPAEAPVRPRTRSGAQWAVAILGCLMGVAALIAGGLLTFGTGSPSATATGTPTSATPPSTDQFDDFTGPALDPAKWRIDDPRGVFTQVQGSLFVDATSPGASSITARPVRASNTIRSTVQVQDATGGGTSGVSIALIGEHGQRRVLFGSGPAPGSLGYRIQSCSEATCADPRDVGGGQVARGVEETVIVSSQHDSTVVTLVGTPPVTLDALGAVSDLRIDVTTAPGTTCRLAIDGVGLLQK